MPRRNLSDAPDTPNHSRSEPMHVSACPRPIALLLLFLLSPAVLAAPAKVFGWIEEGILEPEHITVKIKLDTGALTSSMDARDQQRFTRDGKRWVRFKIEVDDSRTGKRVITQFERPIARMVKVRGAGGADSRAVVFMAMCIGDRVYREEFSLNNRGDMLYPVLIGRRTIQHLGLVDVSRTFTRKPTCRRDAR